MAVSLGTRSEGAYESVLMTAVREPVEARISATRQPGIQRTADGASWGQTVEIRGRLLQGEPEATHCLRSLN
jgi:hypothetical protein